ncbi:MAG: glycerophosphodiester phosphodiesterase family protein [Acidiferrobacter sp.]
MGPDRAGLKAREYFRQVVWQVVGEPLLSGYSERLADRAPTFGRAVITGRRQDFMIELVAHRGYAHRYPENTLVALEAAVAAGARYVEIDVQLTADQVPVLFHDHDCQRLCGVSGTIDERTSAEIRALSAGWPERFGDRFRGNPLARLEDLAAFLARNPDVTAFVEIKRQAVRRFGADAIVSATYAVLCPVLAQTVLISFSLPALKVGRARWPRIGIVTRRYHQFWARGVQALAPEYHFCDSEGLPARGALGHEGCLLGVYEVDDAAYAHELGVRGVAFVETFAIAELDFALRGLGP